MAKFLRLVNNEWRKLFAKAGTWIMAVLVCVLALGITALSLLANSLFSESSYVYTLEESCRDDIDYYTELLESVENGDSVNTLDWQIQLTYNQLLLELEITDWNDWRYTTDIVYEAASAKCKGDTATYEKYLAVIEKNDHLAYFALQKALMAEQYVGEQLQIYLDALDYCIEHEVIPSSTLDGRWSLVNTVIENKETLLAQQMLQESGGAWSEATVEKAKNKLAIAEYQLEHDMLVNPADSFSTNSSFYSDEYVNTSPFWDNMKASEGLITVIALFCIIIAGNIVANEYAAGTVKFLLISPVKRWKILFSKYATVLTVALLMTVSLFVTACLASLSLGGGDMLLPALYAEGGVVTKTSPFLLLLGNYALAFLEVAVMGTLAFTISSMAKSASVAVGISLFAYMMGTTIVSILKALGLDGARYLIFANLDLAAIADGTSVFPHQSLPVAIAIIILHLAVFLFTAHDAFVRREI